jgi:hypothetical protein
MVLQSTPETTLPIATCHADVEKFILIVYGVNTGFLWHRAPAHCTEGDWLAEAGWETWHCLGFQLVERESAEFVLPNVANQPRAPLARRLDLLCYA